MIQEEMFMLYNPWCYLQQPAHPTAGMNASFRALLAAIDQGWEILEPVLVTGEGSQATKCYHFTLLHMALGQTHLLSVAASSEVEHFISGTCTGSSRPG
jgi:hypothetical protein